MCKVNDNCKGDWKDLLREDLIASVIYGPNTDEKIIEDIGYYYTYYAPAFLYKYYSDNTMNLDAVKANKIWFSAPCNFNDVFDSDISIDEKEVLQSAVKMIPDARGVRVGSPMWRELQNMVRKELSSLRKEFDNMRQTTGISCFSESDTSLLMWAHYANNHRGICVEYELLEINQKTGFSPVPVIYSNERAVFNSISLDTIEKDTTRVFINSLTSKSSEWSYENEWRIIQDEGACGLNWDSNTHGALLNMIKPSSIIMGCQIKPEFEREVYNYCEENKINLYKMKKDIGIYKLEKTTILKFD